MPGFLSSFFRISVVLALLCLSIFLMAMPYLANASVFCATTQDGVLYCTDDLDHAPSALTFTERTGKLKDFARYTPLGHQLPNAHKWSVPTGTESLAKKEEGVQPVGTESMDDMAAKRFRYYPYAPRRCIGPHQHAWSSLPVSDCGGFGVGPHVVRDGTRIVPHTLRTLNRRPPIIRVKLVP